MPLCSAEPLMIVTIKLASIPTPGLPPNLVFEHLSTYLPGNINHVVIPFDLSTSGVDDAYTATMDRLVHSLEHGEMIRYFISSSPLFSSHVFQVPPLFSFLNRSF